MASYDEKEIARVFGRIPCMGCNNWQADMVRAKVLAFLVAHWDGSKASSRHRPKTCERFAAGDP
jgi:hypothetical protein